MQIKDSKTTFSVRSENLPIKDYDSIKTTKRYHEHSNIRKKIRHSVDKNNWDDICLYLAKFITYFTVELYFFFRALLLKTFLLEKDNLGIMLYVLSRGKTIEKNYHAETLHEKSDTWKCNEKEKFSTSRRHISTVQK